MKTWRTLLQNATCELAESLIGIIAIYVWNKKGFFQISRLFSKLFSSLNMWQLFSLGRPQFQVQNSESPWIRSFSKNHSTEICWYGKSEKAFTMSWTACNEKAFFSPPNSTDMPQKFLRTWRTSRQNSWFLCEPFFQMISHETENLALFLLLGILRENRIRISLQKLTFDFS